jgi:organic radical activating enzyme
MFEEICSAPWRNLFVGTDGFIKTCCVGKTNLGHVDTDNINDILSGEKLNNIRTSILNNSVPINCLTCKSKHDLGFSTEKNYHTNPKRSEEIKNSPDTFVLKSLDIRWNNTCNLTCIYCEPYWSSSWAALEGKQVKRPDNTINKEEFLKFLTSNLSGVDNILVLGGEPLLIKENIDLLNNLTDNTSVYIISNLSIPNLEDSKIYQALKNKKITWGISFETLNDKFEYVRHGANWKIFNQNLDLLLSNSNFAVNAQSVFNIFSAYDIESFYLFCKERHMQITWDHLFKPKEFDILNAPATYKNLIIEKLEDLIKNSENNYKFGFINLYNLLKNNNAINTSFAQTIKFIKNNEIKLKKQVTFLELFPEFKDYLDHDMLW